MKHNKKRVSKIVDELTTYMFSLGATDININIQDGPENYKISIRSNYKNELKEKIDLLIAALKSPKREEIEEYYWELTGESDVGTEIYLVGAMIDDVEVCMEDNMLTIDLYRNK